MSQWTDHVAGWKDCERCPLHKQRGRICLARGDVPCTILFVGEAPGVVEDTLGLPFKGPAGVLLDQIIERALPAGMTYALTNLVSCFPALAKARGDNEPEDSEIKSCEPRLIEFVNIARPRLIVCVGTLAARWINHKDSIPCVDITHPAAILRMPLAKKQMEFNQCVVAVRCAIEEMLASGDKEFTQWRNNRVPF